MVSNVMFLWTLCVCVPCVWYFFSVCLLCKERKKEMELCGEGGGMDLGEIKGGETRKRIYCTKKFFFN